MRAWEQFTLSGLRHVEVHELCNCGTYGRARARFILDHFGSPYALLSSMSTWLGNDTENACNETAPATVDAGSTGSMMRLTC